MSPKLDSGACGAAPRGVAELAARQHGVVAARQLRALGLDREWVRYRLRAGWLHGLHRGVYAVGHPTLTRWGSWMAAVLASGPGAAISHRSAGELWGLLRPSLPTTVGAAQVAAGELPTIEVTIPSYNGRLGPRGVKVHRATTLASREVVEHHGVPVTAPARTLLDLAAVVPRRPLERAIDEAERLRLTGLAELEATARIHRGRRGAGRLNAVLAEHAIGSTLTRSELEERFLDLCRRRGLPQPEVNQPLLDFVVDFLWRGARLVVEVDGRAAHETSGAFQRDRDRDSLLAAHGYRVLRFTWWDVTRRPAVVAHRVRRTLRGR